MKVTFVFQYYNAAQESKYVVKLWNNKPLPSIGDRISYEDDEFTGVVKRIEWNLDDTEQVHVIIS
jgi:hypothetical protein